MAPIRIVAVLELCDYLIVLCLNCTILLYSTVMLSVSSNIAFTP
jgi:hypothetical protein